MLHTFRVGILETDESRKQSQQRVDEVGHFAGDLRVDDDSAL